MTSAQVVETSVIVNNNSSFQNYTNPDDHTQQTKDDYVEQYSLLYQYFISIKLFHVWNVTTSQLRVLRVLFRHVNDCSRTYMHVDWNDGIPDWRQIYKNLG